MTEDPAGLVRIERAIYIVGSLILLLLGIQGLAITSLTVYDTISGPFSITSHTSLNWGIEYLVSFLELLGGLALASLAMRANRRIHTAT